MSDSLHLLLHCPITTAPLQNFAKEGYSDSSRSLVNVADTSPAGYVAFADAFSFDVVT
jgi:hypothetical protein